MRSTRLAVALAITFAAPAALAFGPHDDAGMVSRSMDLRIAVPATASTPARATAAFDRLVAATGAWQAIWDADTAVPVRMWGAGIPTPGAQRDPAIAERAARALIEAHLDLFAPGAGAADLELIGNSEGQDLRTLTFAQRWHGMRVVGGTLTAMFKRDRLFMVGSTAVPGVAATEPASLAAPSTARARQWVAAEVGRDVTVTDTGAPVIYAEVPASGSAIRFTVARPLVVEADAGFGAWTVWIDAATGEPLARISRVMWGAGTLTYNTPVGDPDGPRVEIPAAFAAITVDGAPVTTDRNGLVTWQAAAPSSVVTALTGPFVSILDSGGHALGTATLPLTDGGTASWGIPTDEFGDGQITAFAHANVMKQTVRHQMNPFLPWVDSQITISVNEPQVCNAFADLDPDMVHFFIYGKYPGFGTCNNTARIPDVVYHESGHNLHYRSMLANGLVATTNDFFNGDIPSLSEGLADTMSTAITGSPIIGPGFFVGDPNGIRTMDPVGIEKHYPEDLSGFDPHASGEIIGGAIWDLRKALVAGLGEVQGQFVTNRAFNGVVGHSTLFTSTYADAIAADDDDGNLANGTPNQCEISRAFFAHGLAPTGLAGGVAIGTPSITGTTISVPVTVPAADCPGLTVSAINVTWQVRGDATMTGMVPLVAGPAWTGTLPVVADGSVVQYQIGIMYSDGSTGTRPLNAADPYYEAYVGPTTVIRCDDFEADPGWTHAATTGVDEWERGPGGTAPAAGDATSAVSGATIFGTDVTDNGLYSATADTYAEMPAVDTTGYATIRLQYRRWLDVDDGFLDQATIGAGGTALWTNKAGTDAATATNVHRDGEWRFQDVDLTAAAAGGTVAVRFGLTANGDRQLGGWNLDDVCVVGAGTTCGDTFMRGGETCDDGNTEGGDGCDELCQVEPPDEGGCCSTGSDPTGALASIGFGAFGLLVVLRRRPSTRRKAPRSGRTA